MIYPRSFVLFCWHHQHPVRVYFLGSRPKQVPNCKNGGLGLGDVLRPPATHPWQGERERVDSLIDESHKRWVRWATLLLQWQVDMDLFYRPSVGLVNTVGLVKESQQIHHCAPMPPFFIIHMFCDFSDPNTCFSSTFLCLLIFRFATAHWSYIISLCFS